MKKSLLGPRTAGTICEILLDEQRYYFNGDHIKGRLVIIPSKPLKLTGIRLEFYGHIKTYINTRKQDGHYFFRELFPLAISPGTLKPGQTYNYPFEFNLPADTALPSCTESDTNTGGMIEYVIKATTDRPSREAIMTCFHLPVLERLDISKAGMVEPVWDKVTWQSQYPEDIIDQDEYHGVDQVDFAASIPHKGYTRGQEIPVTVDIHHFQPYLRPKGLTISLIRSTKILCKEKAYILSPTIVDSVKVDIDIQHTTGQSVTKKILIPRHISPTVTLNARLMEVDYRIQVQADLGNRKQKDMDLANMRLEIPVVIGTLPSPLTPPDTLDPKFVKGVKYVGQETLPKQPQQHSSSLFPSFDFSAIPSALLEISASNLRGDTFASSRRYSKKQQHQPTWSPPGSVHDTNPLSLTTASTSTPSKTTARSSSLLSPTSTIPVYKSDLQQQPYYLTLSLGEPFDPLPTSFSDNNPSSGQSVELSLEEKKIPIALDDRSTASLCRNSINPSRINNWPLAPRNTETSSKNSMDPPHSPETYSRNSMDANQSSITATSHRNSMDYYQPSNSSPLANIHAHEPYQGNTTSSRNSTDYHQPGNSPPLPNINAHEPHHGNATSNRNSTDYHQPGNSSPLTNINAHEPHHGNTTSSRNSTDYHQPGNSPPLTNINAHEPHHDSTTSSSRHSAGYTPQDKKSQGSPSTSASPLCSTTSSSADHPQITPLPEETLPPSPPPQITSPSNRSSMDRPLTSPTPQCVDPDISPFRQDSTYSNYQHTTESVEEYKPVNIVDTVEPIHFDKPHEMVDSDSDDDSDDFISILARREKQAVSNDYWQ